jgi:DNA-binding transcriptional ArsR family regulator
MTKKEDDFTSIIDIDKLIHEPSRLLILAHLYVVESVDFLFLMHQTEMTAGNLSSHLSKLEDAEYVEIVKEFLDKKPHTMVRLTKIGRDAFNVYRKSMKRIVDNLPEK